VILRQAAVAFVAFYIELVSGERDLFGIEEGPVDTETNAREYLLATRLWFALVASHIQIIMGWNARLTSAGNLAPTL
jgi:hypothetical protein